MRFSSTYCCSRWSMRFNRSGESAASAGCANAWTLHCTNAKTTSNAVFIFVSVCSTIRRGLDAVKLRVLAALRHQRLMRAYFDDTRAVQYHDQVGHAYSAEAMRHQDRNAAVGR